MVNEEPGASYDADHEGGGDMDRRGFLKWAGLTVALTAIPFKVPDAWGLTLDELQGTEELYEMPGTNFSIRMVTVSEPPNGYEEQIKPGMVFAELKIGEHTSSLRYFHPGVAEIVRQAQEENTRINAGEQSSNREIPTDAIPFLISYHDPNFLKPQVAYKLCEEGGAGRDVLSRWYHDGKMDGLTPVRDPGQINIDNWMFSEAVIGEGESQRKIPLFPIAGIDTDRDGGIDKVLDIGEKYGFDYTGIVPFQLSAQSAKTGYDGLKTVSVMNSTNDAVKTAMKD